MPAVYDLGFKFCERAENDDAQPLTINERHEKAVFKFQLGQYDLDTLQTVLGEGSHPVAYRLAKIPDEFDAFVEAYLMDDVEERSHAVFEARKAIFASLPGQNGISPYYVEYALDKFEAVLDDTLDDNFPFKTIFGTARNDRRPDAQGLIFGPALGLNAAA